MEADDINALMREGHIYIGEVEELCIALVERHCSRLRSQASLLEIGCASGILAEKLATRLPELQVSAHEDYAPFAERAAKRFDGTRITLHSGQLSAVSSPVDLLLSAGAHHHLPSGYLDHARSLLNEGGVFVLADEFCPEYCTPEDMAELSAAKQIRIVNGYVLISDEEVAAYAADQTLPARAKLMEVRRRKALWHWYRHVVDHAMAHGHIEVAVAELTSARDDLITGCDAEHKLSPFIAERQLELAGFEIVAKHVFGPPDDVSLQSIIAYEIRIREEPAQRSAASAFSDTRPTKERRKYASIMRSARESSTRDAFASSSSEASA
jgi:SAM-dependent methyltransferase